jgi:hypothetical protein
VPSDSNASISDFLRGEVRECNLEGKKKKTEEKRRGTNTQEWQIQRIEVDSVVKTDIELSSDTCFLSK